MNRFLRSSLPCLLDSTVRSSLYPSSSVLSTLPPLRHFSNKSQEHLRNVWLSGLRDPYIRMVGDWETLMLRYHDYDPYYIDPRVVYVSNNRDPKVTSYKNITVFQHTEVTSYKNITVFDVDSIVDAEIPLHIFDSAVPVLSCLYGVKIETIAIFQQMTRFQFPMFIFIDDIELEGADPWNFFDQVKSKLNHRCAAIQVPLRSIDDCYIGFVDLVKLKASYFPSKKSSRSRFFDRLANKLKEVEEVAKDMQAFVLKKRRELIEIVSEVDDKLSEDFHGGSQISESVLDDAIRRATIARKFVPIFMGTFSDERYEGLELLREGVIRYLPSPIDVSNYALDLNKNGEKIELSGSIDAPFVAKAFTNNLNRSDLLTYLRIYQGVIKKDDFITNVNTGEKIQILTLCKRHDDEIEYVDEAHAGEIVMLFDALLKSGDTFTDGSVRYTMTSADVPTYSVS
ncbi:elongation factor G [Medicago truncatula]|uniref:Elongation factor G n=2 Tax=Medicago truncatula TaxID=3880 RepID=G7LAJ2_MEDTR|nr:elongation factor G [Medicago truncatula]